MTDQNIEPSDLFNPFSSLEKEKNTAEKYRSDPKYDEKHRLYTIFTSDVAWTMNKEGKVSYVSPFLENCIGHDADKVLKNIVSNFLSPVSVVSCLIELEELKALVKAGYHPEPRKLFVESLRFEEKIKSLEITTYLSYDSMGNFIGFTGTCHEVI